MVNEEGEVNGMSLSTEGSECVRSGRSQELEESGLTHFKLTIIFLFQSRIRNTAILLVRSHVPAKLSCERIGHYKRSGGNSVEGTNHCRRTFISI